jgi:predicted Fe-S protein YdhL (DUF1289 family)
VTFSRKQVKMGRARVRLASLGFLLLAGAAPVRAQQWPELSPRERYEVLRRYEQYQREPSQRQEQLENRYRRWQQMPPEEKQKLRQRYELWQRLPPREREQLKERYQREQQDNSRDSRD